jgi:uncharacterized protein YndB with AHSA1/START domain
MSQEPASGEARLAPVIRQIRDGRTIVVFVREFEHAPRDVWTMLTDPERLRLWAPHTADRNLSTVGKVVFTMLGDESIPSFDVPGAVLVAAPPLMLEHSWATDVLDWRLETRTGGGSILTLRHTLADPAMASAVAAGWHLCLDVADAALAGHPTAPVRGAAALDHGWSELNARYAEALAVEPTRIELS